MGVARGRPGRGPKVDRAVRLRASEGGTRGCRSRLAAAFRVNRGPGRHFSPSATVGHVIPWHRRRLDRGERRGVVKETLSGFGGETGWPKLSIPAFGPVNAGLRSSRQFPTRAIVAADESVGGGAIGGPHVRRVPFQADAAAKGDVAQMVGFGQPAGVIEVAGCRLAGLAGREPLGVMADRGGNRRLGGTKPANLSSGNSRYLP